MVSLKAVKESDWVIKNLGSVAQDIKNTGIAVSQFPVREAFTTIGVLAVLGFSVWVYFKWKRRGKL